ncbi:class I SAM-dependent methyltransferase, partial [Klebsiella oxytoca]|nr:class I SAM-dependent methyltransferase [Klebsiella oxytoca]
LAQRFHCTVYAIDMDKGALAKARQNIVREGVDHRVIVMEANAGRLPFADETFDVVINEAMLTMYADKAKEKLVAEYFRVLKPGGRLLTHDIMYTHDTLGEDARRQLQGVVKSNVSPLSAAAWRTLFQRSGFDAVSIHHGPMSLMSPRGLMKDEGFIQALIIVCNGLLKRENRPRFLSMLRFFQRHKKHLNFIACCSVKAIQVKSPK